MAGLLSYFKTQLDTDPDEKKVKDILKALGDIPVTYDSLKTTELGKAVSAIKKRNDSNRERAKALLAKWKEAVAKERSPDTKPSNGPSIEETVKPSSDKKHSHTSHEDKARKAHSSSKTSHKHASSRSAHKESSKTSHQESSKSSKDSSSIHHADTRDRKDKDRKREKTKDSRLTEDAGSISPTPVSFGDALFGSGAPVVKKQKLSDSSGSKGMKQGKSEVRPESKKTPELPELPSLFETPKSSDEDRKDKHHHSSKHERKDERKSGALREKHSGEKSRHKEHRAEESERKPDEHEGNSDSHNEKSSHKVADSQVPFKEEHSDHKPTHKHSESSSKSSHSDHKKADKHRESSHKRESDHKKSHHKSDSKRDGNKDSKHTSKSETESKHKDKKKHLSSSKSKSAEPKMSWSPTESVNDEGESPNPGVSFEDALFGAPPPVVSVSKKPKVSDGHKAHKHKSSSKKEKEEKRHKDKPEKSSASTFVVPKALTETASFSRQLSIHDILSDEVAALPAARPIAIDQPRYAHEEDDMQEATEKVKTRSKLYAGRKKAKTVKEMMSLQQLAVNVLIDHIDEIGFVGTVPMHIFIQVLQRATPPQLLSLEDDNPSFPMHTDAIWEGHVKRQYPGVRREEMETWREVYLRAQTEKADKLRALTAKIFQSTKAAQAPIKRTMLAFVNGPAKAPRDVRRRQIRYGTAGQQVTRLREDGTEMPVKKVVVPRANRVGQSLAAEPVAPKRYKKDQAPLFKKSREMFKKLQRRR